MLTRMGHAIPDIAKPNELHMKVKPGLLKYFAECFGIIVYSQKEMCTLFLYDSLASK